MLSLLAFEIKKPNQKQKPRKTTIKSKQNKRIKKQRMCDEFDENILSEFSISKLIISRRKQYKN